MRYVAARTREKREPVAKDVQDYMLGEWGISRQLTSSILRDLAAIGMITARTDLRICARAR
jgi:hypothetical protein